MGKKINQLTSADQATVNTNTRLFVICDPVTGISGKMTIAQAKVAFGSFKKNYVAAGGEATLVLSELAGMEILSISREGAGMYQNNASPDSTEFGFDGTTITFGQTLRAAERLLIIYKVPG